MPPENNTGHRVPELTGSESRDWPPWREGECSDGKCLQAGALGRASQWFEESEAGRQCIQEVYLAPGRISAPPRTGVIVWSVSQLSPYLEHKLWPEAGAKQISSE